MDYFSAFMELEESISDMRAVAQILMELGAINEGRYKIHGYVERSTFRPLETRQGGVQGRYSMNGTVYTRHREPCPMRGSGNRE